MAIYRGSGGSGDANNNITINEVENLRSEAQQAASYSEEWANKAEDSLVSSNAGGDGVDEYSSMHWSIKSGNSASAASTSATNASNSASAASTSASNASTSETNAASSASAASTSETNAATSASNASTSETNAASSETAAADSKTYAQEWANNPEDSLISTAAGGDGVDDYSALHQAKKSEGSASAASTSETNAANSASAASTSASNASTSETNAADSASAASTSETNAASSASAASTSETNAAASLYDFKGRWLGGQASDPATDLNGDALNAGDAYFNTTTNKLKTYNGSAWQVAPAAASDVSIDGTGLNTSATNVQQAVEGVLIGRKNTIINGNFDIWQRGTSFTNTNNAYTADRWDTNRGNGAANVTREAFTLGQPVVPGEPRFFLRYEVTTASTGGIPVVKQKVESVRTLAGQKATISLWAKASKAIALNSIALIQNFGTGGTPSSAVSTIATSGVNLTTSWQKITATVDVPSISGKTIGTDGNDNLEFRITTLNNDTFTLDIAQVQLEKGSVATDFEQRPIGEELALCQRYYEVGNHRIRDSQSTGKIGYQKSHNVLKRTTPTLITTPVDGTINNSYATEESIFVDYNDLASGNGSCTYTLDAEL